MSPRRASCPSPVELERAFWTDDAGARAHAEECDRCGREWAEILALVDAGRAIPPPAPAPERREEIRTALLTGTPGQHVVARASRARWWTAGAAAGAAIAVVAAVWWAWPQGGPEAAPAERGRLLAHQGARYLRASAPPDEIVRLVDGTVSVEVDRLAPGERFRIVTGDAEVEVRGTAFDITASSDRLRSVRVVHGAVEVRRAGAVRVLTGGQSWDAAEVGGATADSTAVDARPAGDAGSAGAAGGSRAPDGSDRPASPGQAGARAPRPRSPAMQGRIDRGSTSPARAAAQQAYDEGWAALRVGAFDRAAAAFGRAAAGDRADSIAEDARYWRAVALARAGNAASATAAFEAFLADHPSSVRAGEASVMLGWILFERGDHAAAARLFRAGTSDPSERIRSSAAKGLSAIRRAEP